MQRPTPTGALRLPRQATPIVRDAARGSGPSGPGRGVEAALLTADPSAPTAPVVSTSPCTHLSGMARQICYSLHYGLAV